LPAPILAPVSVPALVQRVAALDRTPGVRVVPGPPAWIRGDADQLEQLLINLIKNGVEAASETGGGVSIGWEGAPGEGDLGCSDRHTSSAPSTPPSPRAPESAWCCAARSPRPTGGRSPSATPRAGGGATRACACHAWRRLAK